MVNPMASHSVPCCSILTPRCSVTPPAVSTTRFPRCVDQHASILQMSSASFWRNKLRQHRSVHRSSHGTRRVEQISSVAFQTCEVSTCCFTDCAAAFLASECDVFLLPSTSVSLTRRRWHSTRHVPVPRGQVVRSAWRRLGSSVDAPCRASHGGSTQLPRCRSEVPFWPSAPTGALHSVCVAVS